MKLKYEEFNTPLIGKPIYRICHTGFGWQYCIYELIRAFYSDEFNSGWIELAPIITYYNANYSSHSTFQIKNKFSDELSSWVRDWDYITSDQYLAEKVYKEKNKNENQSNNEITSKSPNRN